MNKKKKIILVSCIVLLLSLLIIGVNIILYFTATESYEFIIKDFKNGWIVCKDEDVDFISDLGEDVPKELYENIKRDQELHNAREYYVKPKNALIIGINGNIIDITTLEKGDKIRVVNSLLGQSIRKHR